MKVGLVLVVVSDLAGSGGAERQFSHLHEYLAAHQPTGDITLITATASLTRLQAAGRLSPALAVVPLDLGARPGHGKPAVAWMTLKLLWTTVWRRFDLVHICLPSPIYVPYVAALGWLPGGLRPRVTMTVVDCTLAHSLLSPPPAGTYERQVLDAHRLYERWTRLDGLFTWYREFADAVAGHGRAVVRPAKYCFTESERFRPGATKEPLIVFAGRLSDQKRPLLFVDAVAELRSRRPDLVAGWRFELYGKGVLEREVAARITEQGLADVLSMAHAIDMAPVFARSRLFVSTQAFENFTSLAMLEAMAAGNAVVAEDVGQTREFVRPGENGLVVAPPTARGFADAIAEYLSHPEWHDRMAAASRRLATEVHTVEHFAGDIQAFWRDVLRGPAA